MRVRGVLALAVLSVLPGLILVAAPPAAADTGTSVTPRVVHGTGLGFDTALAVRPSTLRAWTASPYRTVNAYFSGTQRLYTSQPELTADWVTTTLSNGWSIIPTVVDLQAPCYGGSKQKMSNNPTSAANQAWNVANQTHTDLVNIGLGGTIAYLDLENFKTTVGSACDKAVKSFVRQYVHRLHRLGDKAGVYFNAHQGATTIVPLYGHADAPDDVWVANWDGRATTSESVLNGAWPNHRIRQYYSDPNNTTESYAGVAVNIDRDAIAGDVVAAASLTTPGGPPYTYNVNGNQAAGDQLNVRTQPTSSAPALPTPLKGGDSIQIACQATGQTVNGDYVWDKLEDGTGYVSDLYTTTTGRNWVSPSIAKCDTTAPNVSVMPLKPAVSASSATLHWTASDPADQTVMGETRGISSSTVRYQTSTWHSGWSAWHSFTVTTQSATLALTAGNTYCFQVQARDLSGNPSAWSPSTCTSRALDDRSFSASSSWKRITGTKFYLHTATYAQRTGVSLTRTHAAARQIAVVATTCSHCGIARVYIGSYLVGRVVLQASSTHYRVMFVLPRFSLRSGTVKIVTRNSALVQIDGVVISRA